METVKIFVYGTLKQGGRNHDRFCGNAAGIEPATVNGKLYDTGWGFPAVQLSGNPGDIVHGEIITIPECYKNLAGAKVYRRIFHYFEKCR